MIKKIYLSHVDIADFQRRSHPEEIEGYFCAAEDLRELLKRFLLDQDLKIFDIMATTQYVNKFVDQWLASKDLK